MNLLEISQFDLFDKFKFVKYVEYHSVLFTIEKIRKTCNKNEFQITLIKKRDNTRHVFYILMAGLEDCQFNKITRTSNKEC